VFFFASGYEEFTGAVLTLESCTFKENIATEGGALYYWDGGIPSFSIPPFKASLLGCVFEKNIATNGYGGAYSFTGFDKSSFFVDVIGCEFRGNLSSSYYITNLQAGEDSYCEVLIKDCKYIGNKHLDNPSNYCYPVSFGIGGTGSRLDAKIENCLFAGNGGGVSSLVTLSGGGINTYISNCTFYDNNEFLFNKSYYSLFNGVDHFANTYLNNCVIWQPETSVWDMFSDNNFMIQKLDGYQVDNCLLSLGPATINFYSIFGSNNIPETDPLFVNVPDGDFRLDACSPAVNAGNNLIVDTMGILTDLDGNPRIRFDTVDIGAYETQDSCFISSSYEPLTASVSGIISPNPASPGSLLEVQVFGLKQPKIEWVMRDAYGRAVSSGSTLLVGKAHFSVTSPAYPGIYFLELRSDQQSVWLKFIVQG